MLRETWLTHTCTIILVWCADDDGQWHFQIFHTHCVFPQWEIYVDKMGEFAWNMLRDGSPRRRSFEYHMSLCFPCTLYENSISSIPYSFFILYHYSKNDGDSVLSEVWQISFPSNFLFTMRSLTPDSTMLHTSAFTSYLDLYSRLHPPSDSFTVMVTTLCWNMGSLQHKKELKPESLNYTSNITAYIFKLMYLCYDYSVFQWLWLLNMITELMSHPKLILLFIYYTSSTLQQCSQP